MRLHFDVRIKLLALDLEGTLVDNALTGNSRTTLAASGSETTVTATISAPVSPAASVTVSVIVWLPTGSVGLRVSPTPRKLAPSDHREPRSNRRSSELTPIRNWSTPGRVQ